MAALGVVEVFLFVQINDMQTAFSVGDVDDCKAQVPRAPKNWSAVKATDLKIQGTTRSSRLQFGEPERVGDGEVAALPDRARAAFPLLLLGPGGEREWQPPYPHQDQEPAASSSHRKRRRFGRVAVEICV